MQAAQARGRGRVHRAIAAGLRHDHRGARRQSLRRPAPAHRHRARARDQPAHPDLRRGDFGARLRERAHHPGQHARDRARAHGAHHRPPARGGCAPARASSACTGARSSRSARTRNCWRAATASIAGCGRCSPTRRGLTHERARPPPPSRNAGAARKPAPAAHVSRRSRDATANSCPPRWKSWRRRRRRCRSR